MDACDNISIKIKKRLRRNRRLIFVWILLLLSLLTIFVGSIIYGLRYTINFFRTPSQITANDLMKRSYFRLGGYVVPNSVVNNDNLTIFKVSDGIAEIEVSYSGILPNLFAEGEYIIAEGALENSNSFVASRILAKHDEKYKPPAIEATQEKLMGG